MVYLDVQKGRLNWLFKKLYNDTPNIQFGTVTNLYKITLLN